MIMLLLGIVGIAIFIGLMWLAVKISLKSLEDNEDFEEESKETNDSEV